MGDFYEAPRVRDLEQVEPAGGELRHRLSMLDEARALASLYEACCGPEVAALMVLRGLDLEAAADAWAKAERRHIGGGALPEPRVVRPFGGHAYVAFSYADRRDLLGVAAQYYALRAFVARRREMSGFPI